MLAADVFAAEWLKKADDDELNARSILAHRDGTPGMVCFLSQQMAEKLLKSLLSFHGIEFQKVHDLTHLSNLLSEKEPELGKYGKDFAVLNRYYIETRYPGDYPDFSWEEAETAFGTAREIKKLVLKRL